MEEEEGERSVTSVSGGVSFCVYNSPKAAKQWQVNALPLSSRGLHFCKGVIAEGLSARKAPGLECEHSLPVGADVLEGISLDKYPPMGWTSY